MTAASEQATRFATVDTPAWRDKIITTELRYTINRVRAGHDPEPEWVRLHDRLLSICRHAEHGHNPKAAA